MQKINKLIERIREIGECYLMFSGGMDSCAILGAAKMAHVTVTPVWIDNGFGRASEYLIRKQVGLISHEELRIIPVNPIPKAIENPTDRCYHCKGQIIKAIQDLGSDVLIIDGTTGSDTGYRPGRKALSEHGVISPLAELGITSAEAKEIAIKMGADQDIADLESCLATRINYNVALLEKTLDVVRNIEQAVIAETQDYNVRCRVDDADHIRIELSNEESFKAIANREFRNNLITLGEQFAMFTTIDLKPSRPNAYDSRICNLDTGK
ncbi:MULTISPECIES: exoenzyme S synthesis protein B [unclassified Saccharicrinis]|uniref:exoenzyme S synthesis protein B n=1 Tax=unclassified Saccharicrinis TaxID=2646859 RepID=UPI003D337EF5